MFLKPFLYLFVLVVLVNLGNLFAQETPEADSLNVVAATDTLRSNRDSVSVKKTRPEPPFKTRIKYKANDSIKIRIPEQKIYLYNEGQVNYENIELKAYETEFDMKTKIVHANSGKDSTGNKIGAPVFKQGNESFDTDSLSYNFGTSKGVIHAIKTQQGEGYMHATKSKRYADGHIDMGGGKYTTCDADHPHFYLALSKAKVIPGDQVVFGPAHMVLLDIPLPLFLPFGFFPYTNKQSVSGVLPPSIGMEVTRGLSLTNGGYYFAFSDHFDATIRGDIWSNGQWKANLATRYMNRYHYSGTMNFNYGVTYTGEKGLDRSQTKEYSIQWTHTQDAKANPYRNFSASVNYSSSSYDSEYNFTSPSLLYTNTKSSSISFQKSWPNSPFRLTANLNHSQSSGNITLTIPSIAFSMDRIYPFRKKESAGKPKWYEDIALVYNANLDNSLTGEEGSIFTANSLKNMKNGFQHRIPLSINFKTLNFINITPSVNYTGVAFTNKIRKTFYPDSIGPNEKPGVLVVDTTRGLFYAHSLAPTLSISATPKFYLTNQYGHDSKVEAIRTIISPSATVSYTPDMGSLFDYRDSYTDASGHEEKYDIYAGKYSVPPTAGQSGSVSVGLNGSVEMKVRSDKDTTGVARKIKILDRFNATSSYNMFRDSMKWENISLAASTTLFGLNLNLGGHVNPYKLTPEGIRINQFGPQLTDVNLTTGISLPLEQKTKKEGEKAGDDDGYSYFDVPWNVSLAYTFGYSKPQFVGTITQNLTLTANVTLTKKWSLNFQSAYDFNAKTIAYLNGTINRDLHCWTMSFSFSAFGPSKFFYFQINVKSTMLRDLKYEKRKSQYDYTQW